jgi:hypothetical protein
MSAHVRGASKELRSLYKELARLGCELSLTSRNHVAVRYPDGRYLTYPLTSTNLHAVKRLKLEIRRLKTAKNGS